MGWKGVSGSGSHSWGVHTSCDNQEVGITGGGGKFCRLFATGENRSFTNKQTSKQTQNLLFPVMKWKKVIPIATLGLHPLPCYRCIQGEVVTNFVDSVRGRTECQAC